MFIDDLKERQELYLKVASGKRLSALEQVVLDELRNKHGISKNGTVRGQDKLAGLLGYSKRTVIRWKKEGMPIEPDGSYDPIRILEWKTDLFDDAENSMEISAKAKWDIDFRKFRALIAELDYKKQTGEVIPLSDVEQLLTTRAAELKQSLHNFSRVVSPELAHKSSTECQGIMDEYVNGLLEAYSRPNTIVQKKDGESDAENKH